MSLLGMVWVFAQFPELDEYVCVVYVCVCSVRVCSLRVCSVRVCVV